MKCYYHPNVEAVGVCKNCGKALCHESIVEFGQFLACKESKACQYRVRYAAALTGPFPAYFWIFFVILIGSMVLFIFLSPAILHKIFFK